MMAKLLTEKEVFDHCLAVAPEGHVYGFFFEGPGTQILPVLIAYPPKQLETRDDLTVSRDGRVLVLEDDVISGVTLQLVVKGFLHYQPRSLSLYLGRAKEDQQLENAPSEIDVAYPVENHLDSSLRERHESAFLAALAKGA